MRGNVNDRGGRKPSRMDKHEPGEDIMNGYVGHARPVPQQVEFVRQQAATHHDRECLVEMILGETTEQTASVYADALGDPNFRELLVAALDDPRLLDQLAIMYELAGIDHVRVVYSISGGQGVAAEVAIINEAFAVDAVAA